MCGQEEEGVKEVCVWTRGGGGSEGGMCVDKRRRRERRRYVWTRGGGGGKGRYVCGQEEEEGVPGGMCGQEE